MVTRLYDTAQQKFISKVFEGGYKVDGKSPELPEGIVELQVIKQPRPKINPSTQYLEKYNEIDLDTKQYIEAWIERTYSEYQIAMRDWDAPQCSHRAICDPMITVEENGTKMFAWLNVNGFPIVRKEDHVRVYFDQIREEFNPMVAAWIEAKKITIEQRPEENQ